MSDRRTRVAFLDSTGQLSGGEISLSRVLPLLRDVESIVVLGSPGPLEQRLVASGADVRVLPLPSETALAARTSALGSLGSLSAIAGVLRYSWRLRRLLLDFDADVVYANTMKSAVYGGLAARLARRPAVWHVRDRIDGDVMPASSAAFLRWWARVAFNRIVANSHSTASDLVRLPTPPAIVPSPVDDAMFSVPPCRDRPPLTISMIGRLSPWKGQEVFVEAISKLNLEPGTRVRIVGAALFGEDEFAAELTQHIHRLGLDATIELRGFRDDIVGELTETDIVVHASTSPEPFGLVIAEAMAAGRTVIAARAGGPLETINDGVDGLLARPGDADDFAHQIGRLLGEPELRSRLGAAARQRAKSFAPEVVAPQIESVCHAAAARAGRDHLPVILINGRFRRMLVSGVQRYADELVEALQRREGRHWAVLAPLGRLAYGLPERRPSSRWGGLRGHMWEQAALPLQARMARADLLVNLCNWGPVATERQVVAFHDAATFAVPEYFERSYATWHRAATRIVGRKARAIITTSERTRQELIEIVGLPEDRIFIVPPAVSSTFRAVGTVDATGPRYCVFVGGHDPRKNAALLLQLWPEVARRTGLTLHVVSHPGSRPHGRETVPTPGIVTHHELDDANLAALYAGAVCLLWPSHYEGFGLPLLEAMATGTPFLSTAVGAAEELSVDERQILSLDPDAWLDAIEWMSDGAADRLRGQCRERADQFSWELSAQRLDEVIGAALAS